MWHWLLSKVPKRYRLWCKLVLFSTGFHGIILFLLLFLYKGSTSIYSFDLSRIAIDADATIVFMPLHKKLYDKQAHHKKGVNAHKEQSQESVAAKPEKSTKKEKAPTTLVAAKTQKKEKKQQKKPKKEQKKVASLPREKEIEKKVEAIKTTQNNNDKAPEANVVEDSNIVYVGREDLEMLQLQQSIYSEISERWSPPRGIPKDATCIVRLLVDTQGEAKNIVIEQSSGITMYDVSARRAVMGMQVPQAAWGKELSITFKQT